VKLGKDVAALKLQDLDGGEVALGETWRERTAVLVFLRHFG
jgi:hypothetical protein